MVQVQAARRSRPDRGQSGLDRLLLFVLAVVALLLVAPHVLGALGIDVDGRPAAPPGEADHDMVVLEARGTAVEGGSIGAVRLVVTPAPGREPVDLGEQIAIWVADRSTYLSPNGDLEGAYRAAVIGGEGQVLESATARGELVFDLGETDDVAGVPEFGSRLEPGDAVAVTIVTPRGETLTRRLEVPATVSGETVPL